MRGIVPAVKAPSDVGVEVEPSFLTRKVGPGECHVTGDGRCVIVTVLGSCIAACIRDPLAGVGGMNHFMLPQSSDGEWGLASAHLRYGNFAMERLVNDILKRGGQRRRLEVKLFGGAAIGGIDSSVGRRNTEFVVTYLRNEKLMIAAQKTGGTQPMRVHYFPVSGRARVRELFRDELVSVAARERLLAARLPQPAAGSVELFGS